MLRLRNNILDFLQVRNISSPMSQAHPAEVEIAVPVGSDEEDHLLDETLTRFAEALAGEADGGALLIVKSEYGSDGLVKTVIFEDSAPAARFGAMWRAARLRLSSH